MSNSLLKVEPKTGENIEFPEIMNKQMETDITLTNPSTTETVAFKMKVNSPKTYLVRPSGGVLVPGQSMTVQIILQGLTEKVNPGLHRFLIHSVTVPTGTVSLTREDWPKYDKQRGGIKEQLLNVVFVKDEKPAAQAAPVTTTTTPASGGDLKAKFDELKGYALSLEKEVISLEESKKTKGSKAATEQARTYGMFHLIIGVLCAIMIVKLPSFL